MADRSRISWTDATYNPVTGCTKVSPGCARCYAEAITLRFKRGPAFLPGVSEVKLHPDRLDQPLHWRRPRRIFVCSMSDLFHEDVPDEFIDRVFAVMALAPQHTFQCLSKRPERMQDYILHAEARVAALVYNARYEQGNSIPHHDPVGRARDRRTGADLALEEAPRQGTIDRGRGLSEGRSAQPLQTGAGGIQHALRLPLDNHDDPRGENSDRCAPHSVGASRGTNPRRSNDQSQERHQERQPARESGVGNDVGATSPRTGCSQGEQASSVRVTTPEDKAARSGCVANPAIKSGRDDGQRDRSSVRDEAKGNLGDLQSEDLAAYLTWPLPNVWLGVSVENQYWADRRIPLLLQTPAAVRFLSLEPLLKAVDLSRVDYGWQLNAVLADFKEWREDVPFGLRDNERVPAGVAWLNVLNGEWFDGWDGGSDGKKVDWVIVGGESGPRHRPMELAWVEDIADQCRAAGVPVFVKQDSGAKPGQQGRLSDALWKLKEVPA